MIRSNQEWEAARARQDAEAARERARADRLWRRLQAVAGPRAPRDLAVEDPEFWTWAFCERLCHESAAAADDDDAGRANELAELALVLAVKVEGEDHLRCRIQEYVWMHVGSARRAHGDLKGAEEALARAQELFVGGTMGILPSPIRRDRLSLIEAALLRDRGRLREALEKVRFAPPRAHRDRERPRPLRPRPSRRGAGAPLRPAQGSGPPSCRARPDPLPGGRAAAGRGRWKEAEGALRKPLADLPDQAIAEAALLSLEIAVLAASRGSTAELRAMIEPIQQLAGAPALGRGAAAALKLFCRLAEQDKLTAERAAQFVRDFPRGPAGL